MSLSASDFDFVRQLVYRESAIVLDQSKEYLVEARLAPLVRQAGLAGIGEYVSAAQRGGRPAQMKIVEALTTNETSWYRDSEPFQALTKTVVPLIRAEHPEQRSLRIWSAACSSGQEPYSLAMLLSEEAGLRGWQTEIHATDISEEMLTKSRSGRYTQLEVNRGLPAPMLVRHFTRAGAEWQLSEAVRRLVTFRHLNLATAFPPMPAFDVVFLRNVLIYFDMQTRRDILKRVRGVLKPGGCLFLGSAETTIGVDDGWERLVVGRTSVHRARAVALAGSNGTR